MVKSLLLGTAAGLVAMSGAQAASMPVKAKPVEYVKVCSVYGAGFYYIPGTQTCLRVGGYVFLEAGWNARGGVALIYNYNIGGDHVINRNDNTVNWRGRGTVILDARTQTEKGTIRTYIAGGWDYNNNLAGAGPGGNITPYFERAFVQWAGFTFGYLESWFDFWPTGVYMHGMALASQAWDWTLSFAYTATFGNGVSLTFAVEDAQATRMRIGTVVGGGDVVIPAGAATGYGGQDFPDLILNLRVDQAWGSAQLAAALHHLRLNAALNALGYADQWGWAVLAGISVNLPSIAAGDQISLQGVYADGNIERTGISTSPLGIAASVGLLSALTGIGPAIALYDSYPGSDGLMHKSKAWSAALGFRHFWVPALHTNFIIGYNAVRPGHIPGIGFFVPPLNMWQAAIGTTWAAVPGGRLNLSLDFVYTNLRTGACFNGLALCANPLVTSASADQFTVWTRWRSNF
jgi:hypothetical protein